MLEKNVSLLFYLKRPKNHRKNTSPVYLRITIDGIRKEIATGRSCDPDRWNSKSGRGNGTKEDIKSLNSFLDTLQLKVHEAQRKSIEKNEPVSSTLLKNLMKGETEKPRMIMDIFQHHNNQICALVGKEFAPGTLERYKTSLDHTRSFMEWKYNISDIDIKKLDYEFVSEYSFWLKSIRNCNQNTTVKYISNFRKIVNIAIRHGWLIKDPFLGFKMSKKEVERDVLNQDEIQSIYSKQFPTERLEQVRDIFLFCCFTGLAYADIKKLKRSEIVKGIDGEQWIFTNRQKTETSSRIPLLPMSLEIMGKYREHPQCINLDRVLPVASNQKMNAYLKEIADLCGINKNLTFHIARHTFATTVTLSNGVPIETVSKMLGHKNLRTTQHYAKILDRKVSDDMQILRAKFNIRKEI